MDTRTGSSCHDLSPTQPCKPSQDLDQQILAELTRINRRLDRLEAEVDTLTTTLNRIKRLRVHH